MGKCERRYRAGACGAAAREAVAERVQEAQRQQPPCQHPCARQHAVSTQGTCTPCTQPCARSRIHRYHPPALRAAVLSPHAAPAPRDSSRRRGGTEGAGRPGAGGWRKQQQHRTCALPSLAHGRGTAWRLRHRPSCRCVAYAAPSSSCTATPRGQNTWYDVLEKRKLMVYLP